MGEEFLVQISYPGYVFVGWAAGRFENKEKEKTPYSNMFVLSPASTYESEDFKAFGLKAEKKKCLSSEVWKDLEIGSRVRLVFDDQQRVILAEPDE